MESLTQHIILTTVVTLIVIIIYQNIKKHMKSTNKLLSTREEEIRILQEIQNQESQPTQPSHSPQPSEKDRNIVIDINNRDHSMRLPSNPLRDYDRGALMDPLIPPYKRDEYNENPALVYPSLYSIPTRGFSSSFKRVGYLLNPTADNNDQYKFLILMGKQKYRGSNQYEYYVTSSSKESTIKFDLEKYKKELYTDDKVKIQQLNDVEFDVVIDKNLGFEYTPF